MIPTESLERPMVNGGHAGPNRPFPLYEAETAHGTVSLGDGIDSAVPDWDKLWVDLGGDG